MSEGWERWVNREDHTVPYEARRTQSGYEFRTPGGKTLGVMDRETWEAIYEREVTNDRNEG